MPFLTDPARRTAWGRRRRTGRTVAAAVASTAQGSLPVFMLGGLSVQVRDELDFAADLHGLAVALFFACSGLASTVAGRLIERGGAHAGMVVTAALSGGACLGVAALSSSWAQLAAFMGLAGVANAFAQPAANGLLKRVVSDRRQGLVFGVKQAAIPLTTLLAGVAVPALGLTVGWRWGFAACVGTAVAVAVVAPREETRVQRAPGRQSTGGRALAPLLAIAAAAALGAAPTMSLGVFLVASAVDAGVGQAAAGLLLAGGSVAGVVSRLANGALADRRDGGHLRAVAVMLTVGALGLALLGLGHIPVALVPGVVLAFAAGWGWNGLYDLAVVGQYPRAPAAATGVMLTGFFVGATLGPLGFGLVVEQRSFAAAWFAAAALALGAAAMVTLARALLHRELAQLAAASRDPR